MSTANREGCRLPSHDTVRLTQAQPADLSGKDVGTVNEHIRNISTAP